MVIELRHIVFIEVPGPEVEVTCKVCRVAGLGHGGDLMLDHPFERHLQASPHAEVSILSVASMPAHQPPHQARWAHTCTVDTLCFLAIEVVRLPWRISFEA